MTAHRGQRAMSVGNDLDVFLLARVSLSVGGRIAQPPRSIRYVCKIKLR